MVSLKRKALFTALPFGLSLLVLLTFLHQEPAYVTKLDPTLLLLNPRSPQSTRPFLRNNLRNRAMRVLQTSELLDMSIKDASLLPDGATQRDYVSFNKYCWENSSGGWETREGHINTQIARSVPDYDLFRKMVSHVTSLSLAFLFSEADYTYREKALQLINSWFLDENVGMLPRMEFAGICLGQSNSNAPGSGTRTGILELFPISHVFRALEVLRLGMDDEGLRIKNGLLEWAKEYAEWHETHPFASEEALAPNNHGTAYDIQYLSLLRFINEEPYYPSMYDAHVEQYVIPRAMNAISHDGRQPFELVRSSSWDYSVLNLRLLHLLSYELDAASADRPSSPYNLWTMPPPQHALPTNEEDFEDMDTFAAVANASLPVFESTHTLMPPIVAAHDFLLTHAVSGGESWPANDSHQMFPVQGLLVLIEDINQNLDIIKTNRYGLGQKWTKGIAQLQLIDVRQKSRSTSLKNWARSTFSESRQFMEQALVGTSGVGMLVFVGKSVWAWRQKARRANEWKA